MAIATGYKRITFSNAVRRKRERGSGAARAEGEIMAQPLASVDVSQSFQNLLDTVIHAIPEILVFLVILVAGWLVTRILARVADLILRRAHFDRFVERGVVGQALARSHTDATALIARIVYYTMLLIALQMAFGVFGPNPISAMLNAIVAWLPRAIVAII